MIVEKNLIVALADDHPIFFKSFLKVFDELGFIDICGTAINGLELIHLVEEHSPHIIFTDLKMPIMDGFEATKIIKAKYPSIKVIAISSSDNDEDIIRALDAGVDGYISKKIEIDEMEDIIFNMWEGKNHVSKEIFFSLPKLINRSNFNPYQVIPNLEFSDIELEIIKLICQEKTNEEIADKIHLGKRTIEGKRAEIIKKMNASNSIGIAVYAIKHGIVKV
jgi:DNA-binding NarL/FixJ family response regulator